MPARKPADQRKSEIVETTLRLADKVGPDRLATSQVAQAIGLTQAAIFRHFPTKQDLWEAVAARIGEKFQQRWNAAQSKVDDPVSQLRKLIAAQLKLIQSVPAIPAILFSRELHVENKALRIIFAEFMKTFHTRVKTLVAAGQQTKLLNPEIEATDAALLIIGLVQGTVLRWSVSGRSFSLAEEGSRLLDIQLGCLGAKLQEKKQ